MTTPEDEPPASVRHAIHRMVDIERDFGLLVIANPDTVEVSVKDKSLAKEMMTLLKEHIRLSAFVRGGGIRLVTQQEDRERDNSRSRKG